MSIAILPARLANQIAAGEVVERPASVIKELVENSLDAGATKIQIDVEKGGVKKLRIIDNGCGIAKNQLTLALSRHATSKIKDLSDLESISSLGFRGEALASVSSVSRLILTSKPANQDTAWQASAQGRDMEVTVQPAAHPNGTTIDVNDLFFNTPARRKFLRAEKTEFSHIDEVVKRIALARFDVSFTLSHNGKVVRQYRSVQDQTQYAKRVALVCGPAFIKQAITVDCQHDSLHLWGWLGKPSFYRNQNDLNYSYVNGRMMRDKLINHAIRQAYADLLPNDTSPAFVLFLQLNHREVDVNVHPAKHEVRFHQGRYVHDFIYSVCQRALQDDSEHTIEQGHKTNAALETPVNPPLDASQGEQRGNADSCFGSISQEAAQQQDQPSYIKPLSQINQPMGVASTSPGAYRGSAGTGHGTHQGKTPISRQAVANYQQLMTPLSQNTSDALPIQASSANTSADQQHIPASSANISAGQHNNEPHTNTLAAQDIDTQVILVHDSDHAVIVFKQELRLLSLVKFSQAMHLSQLSLRWHTGLVSQPLLLPIILSLSAEQSTFITKYIDEFSQAGMVLLLQGKAAVQVREFPALLRHKDVSSSIETLLSRLLPVAQKQNLSEQDWCQALACIMATDTFNQETGQALLVQGQSVFGAGFMPEILSRSVVIDLTSGISQLL